MYTELTKHNSEAKHGRRSSIQLHDSFPPLEIHSPFETVANENSRGPQSPRGSFRGVPWRGEERKKTMQSTTYKHREVRKKGWSRKDERMKENAL